MSFFRFTLETTALLIIASVFLRVKSRFNGRPLWVLYAHLVLFGSLAVMAAQGVRMFLYLCFRPRSFIAIFAQQHLFKIEPHLMVTCAVVFALSSLWIIASIDSFSLLRRRPRAEANCLIVFYSGCYPIMLGINIGHLYGHSYALATWALSVSGGTLLIGIAAVAFYRSSLIDKNACSTVKQTAGPLGRECCG